MKRLLSVFLSLPLYFTGNAQNNIDVLHYRFHVAVSDDNDTLFGAAIIKFVVKQKESSIQFDLTNLKKDGKGMLVTVVGYRTGQGIETFKQENNKLIIPSRLNKGDTAEVVINYKGIPSDGLIISKNKYGSRTFFSDNWPNRAHNWIPCVDDPADKATVEFLVVTPPHYKVVSNGVLVEESRSAEGYKETWYKEDVPLPTKVMVIGVADFSVNNTGTVNCVPVSSWVFPENQDKGFYDYAIGKDILSFYMNYIGPFPYKKLANVQSKTIFGGMENAGAIFYFENSVSGANNQETLIAHETVHQWFGDMATEKSFAHLWLSEGFATYLTHIYIESKYGTDSLNKRMRDEREEIIAFVKSSHRPVVDSTADYMQLLNANSYQKGGWVLHMLRRQLGDSVFHKAIREYYATYAGKNAETKDLQTIFETVSGKDLGQFFKQWLFTPENPVLDITWKYDTKKKEVHLHIKQLQQAVFNLPLTISLDGKAGTNSSKNIVVDKKEADFTFAVAAKPTQLITDPLISLLFERKITELQ